MSFRLIHDAFVGGDLDALRAAVDDPSDIPNGRISDTIGSCLVYAVYHSPFAFIRTLLELGANPNAPADDGFPPLIAALMSGREAPGVTRRDDVDELVRLLLKAGADPNQRGINDYTALHMAVAERQALAVQILLDAGADAGLRTRIDDCETPGELAQRAGLTDIAATLARKGQPLRQRLRSGLVLLMEVVGTGELVQRQHDYRIRFREWLADGQEVPHPSGWPITQVTRINRGRLFNGEFYALDGMRVGGTRRVEIAPHMAYGADGIPGRVPPNAVLIVEMTVLEKV